MTESRHGHPVKPYFQNQQESEDSYDGEDDSSDTSSNPDDYCSDEDDCSDESSLTDYHPSEKVRTYFNNQTDANNYVNQ